LSKNISLSGLINSLTFLLFIVATLSFSWNPLVIILPVLFFVSIIKIFYLKLSIKYFFLFFCSYLIIRHLSSQTIYIEWVRNILIAFLIPISYFVFYDFSYIKYQKLLRLVFVSCVVVVLYIVIIEVPKNFGLFFGERRGFYANEYLFFGRKFPFSLGVTHLNIYINYIFTFLFIGLINNGRKRKMVGLIVLFMLIAIATDSRSPILYLLIMLYFYKRFNSKSLKTDIRKKVKYVFIILATCLIVVFSFDYIINLINNSERLIDFSRLIFYAKGFEHMFAEPWGNSLLYTDVTMPLLNYHNTFLALGNRIGLWFFVVIILSFAISLYYVIRIQNVKIRFTFIILLYFCFHNYMVEDIIKFDFFVLLIQFSILPFLISNKIIYTNEEDKSIGECLDS
jgi:hypothetical protein